MSQELDSGRVELANLHEALRQLQWRAQTEDKRHQQLLGKQRHSGTDTRCSAVVWLSVTDADHSVVIDADDVIDDDDADAVIDVADTVRCV